MPPRSVLLVSTSYPRDAADWRARFIADMVEALAASEELELSVWAPTGVLPPRVDTAASAEEQQHLQHMVAQGGIAQILRGSKLSAAKHVAALLAGLRRCYRRSRHDILHINWLQNALPLPVGDRRPALVTVLGSDYRWLALPGVKALLRRTLRRRRALIAPNAEWMVPGLQQAFGDIADVRAIPFGIAPEWYQSQRVPDAPGSGRWLAVTRITPGKIGDLFDWGAAAFDGARSLHLLGPQQDNRLAIPAWVRWHGPTHPAALQAEWFPRAAGLISLSRHDEGRPQVMLEAMAAGLPVIASDLPAHRDIICHGETGFIVRTPDELRQALAQLACPDTNRRMGEAARSEAQLRYGTWADCASRYCAAYAKLMAP